MTAAATRGTERQFGLAMRFRVSVGQLDLGGWSSCQGLAVRFSNIRIKEGANYEYQTLLPDRVDYSSITLRRAMHSADSATVQRWLQDVVQNWYGDKSGKKSLNQTAQIVLMDAHGQTVSSWQLRNVYPLSWKGPDLDAGSGHVALEALELAHEGFL